MDDFTPIKDDFTPATKEQPHDYLSNLWREANTKNLQNASYADPLADIARAGQFAQKKLEGGSQDIVNTLHQKFGVPSEVAAVPGAAINTAGEWFLPQTRLGAVGSIAQGLSKGVGAARGLLGGAASGGELSNVAAESGGQVVSRASGLVVGKDQEYAKALQEYQQGVLAYENSRKAALQSGNSDADVIKSFTEGNHPAYKQMESGWNKIQALEKSNPELTSLRSADEDAINKLAQGPQTAAKGTKPNPPGTLANLITARAGRGITPGEAQYALDNPDVFKRAKSLPQAQADYEAALGGLKGKVQSMSERTGNILFDAGDYKNAVNRVNQMNNGKLLDEAGNKVPMTPQDALEGVQTINKIIRDKKYTASLPDDQLREIGGLKDNLMDYLQNNGAPKLRQAAKGLFEAHVNDGLSKWLPQNKYGSPDALRTMMSMGQGAKAAGAAVGGIVGGVPGIGIGAAVPMGLDALTASPKMWKRLIMEKGALPGAAQDVSNAGVGLSNALSQ